jgi:hypothetical protein
MITAAEQQVRREVQPRSPALKFSEGVIWLLDQCSRSWASHTHHTADVSEDEFGVLQFGPRRLWDEVKAAYYWWVDAGSLSTTAGGSLRLPTSSGSNWN